MHKWVLGIEGPYMDCFIEPPPALRQQLLHRQPSGLPQFRHMKDAELTDLYRQHPGPILPGGAIMNTITQVAALGGQAAFLGIVGCDQAGMSVTLNLEKRGVHQIAKPRADAVSPIIYALRESDQETHYHRVDGDGMSMQGEDMPDVIGATGPIIASWILALPVIDQSISGRIEDWRQRYGAKLALSLQRLNKAEREANPALFEMFKNADYIFGSLEEYQAMLLTQDATTTISGVSKESAGTLYVVTDGPNEILAMQGGEIVARRMPVALDKITCSVGAGDAIMGGALYALSRTDRHWSAQEAIELGARCANNILHITGGQPQPATPGHLRHLIAQAPYLAGR